MKAAVVLMAYGSPDRLEDVPDGMRRGKALNQELRVKRKPVQLAHASQEPDEVRPRHR